MTHRWCHGRFVIGDDECSKCLAELHPVAQELARRSLFWRRTHALFLTAAGLAVTALGYAFLVYREWIIWTR